MTTSITKRVGIPLGIIILAIGLSLAFMGSIWVTKCSDPGGCRSEPIVPLVASGIGLVLVGMVVLCAALRSKPKRESTGSKPNERP